MGFAHMEPKVQKTHTKTKQILISINQKNTTPENSQVLSTNCLSKALYVSKIQPRN